MMKQDELSKILQKHKAWLDEKGGERATLSYADLSYANLCSANLSNANLSNADLRGTKIPNTDVFIPALWGGHAHIRADYIRIGCEYHTVEEWRDFSEAEIDGMASGALEWWKQWKHIVIGIADILITKEHDDEQIIGIVHEEEKS